MKATIPIQLCARHEAPPALKHYANRLTRELGGSRTVVLLMVLFVLFAVLRLVHP